MTDTPIYTLTMNPSIDKTLIIPRLVPGELHRANVARTEIGGKGLNVSTALALLGLPSNAFALIGHREHQRFKTELIQRGVSPRLFPHDGETRTTFTLKEVGNQRETKINETGPEVTAEIGDALVDYATLSMEANALVALSGSVPPGIPSVCYRDAVTAWHEKLPGVRAFVDASGDLLFNAADTRPYAVKINLTEMAELVNMALATEAEYHGGCSFLLGQGIEIVVMTRGADGLILARRGCSDIFYARPPSVQIGSAVAAGDATMAGLLWSIADGCDLETTARRMAACGTAAAMQPGSGVGTRAAVEALLPAITVERRAL